MTLLYLVFVFLINFFVSHHFFFLNSTELFQEEIFASSFAAAAYLESINFPKDKKVRSNFLTRGILLKQWMVSYHSVTLVVCCAYDTFTNGWVRSLVDYCLWLWWLWDVADKGLLTGHDFRFMWLVKMASWRSLSLLDFGILVGQYVWIPICITFQYIFQIYCENLQLLHFFFEWAWISIHLQEKCLNFVTHNFLNWNQFLFFPVNGLF